MSRIFSDYRNSIEKRHLRRIRKTWAIEFDKRREKAIRQHHEFKYLQFRDYMENVSPFYHLEHL